MDLLINRILVYPKYKRNTDLRGNAQWKLTLKVRALSCIQFLHLLHKLASHMIIHFNKGDSWNSAWPFRVMPEEDLFWFHKEPFRP